MVQEMLQETDCDDDGEGRGSVSGTPLRLLSVQGPPNGRPERSSAPSRRLRSARAAGADRGPGTNGRRAADRSVDHSILRREINNPTKRMSSLEYIRYLAMLDRRKRAPMVGPGAPAVAKTATATMMMMAKDRHRSITPN